MSICMTRHEIFDKHSIDEIHALTKYSFHYLVEIREGRKKQTDAMKVTFDLVVENKELRRQIRDLKNERQELSDALSQGVSYGA